MKRAQQSVSVARDQAPEDVGHDQVDRVNSKTFLFLFFWMAESEEKENLEKFSHQPGHLGQQRKPHCRSDFFLPDHADQAE